MGSKVRLVLIGVLALLASNAVAQRGLDPAIEADIETLIEQAMNEVQVPGFTINIIQDSELVYSRGFGVRAPGAEAGVEDATTLSTASSDSSEQPVVTDPQTLMERIREGGRIELSAGVFPLTETLTITTDIELIGAGVDRTIITSEAEQAVVWFQHNGSLTIDGITFEHTGSNAAFVAIVEGGTIDIRDSRFTGGVSRECEIGGSGLWLRGDTRGIVQDSTIDNNGFHGIALEGQAQPILRNNTILNNRIDGLSYSDESAGLAEGNTSEENGRHGIEVQHHVRPTLWNNNVRNAGSGIVFQDHSGGLAEGNTSENHEFHGIEVSQQTTPTLRNNITRHNTGHGIRFSDRAGGLAEGNISEVNSWQGIMVRGEAQPTLRANTTRNNTGAGIRFTDQAGGLAEGNTSEGNEWHGIMVENQAQPTLRDNILKDNDGFGIYSDETARPVVESNDYGENALGDQN